MVKLLSEHNVQKAMKRHKMFKTANLLFANCLSDSKQLCKDLELPCTYDCFKLNSNGNLAVEEKGVKQIDKKISF